MQNVCQKAETESLLLPFKNNFFNSFFFFFNLHIFILIICENVCVSEHVHIHMQYLRLNMTGRYDLRTMLCFHKTGKM